MLKQVAKNQVRKEPDPGSLHQRRYRQVVAKFLATWFFFLGILAVIGLSINIEWLRPEIERGLVATFQRPVKLGRLAWTLGLNGLSVWTDSLVINGRQNEPFVKAARSEIGVAFLPLFQHHVIVKHLKFKNPDLWLVHEGPGSWNFSDLVENGPDVRFLEVESGTVHLRNALADRGPVTWHSYDLQDLNLKLIAPGKKRSWPFYLSFKVPLPAGKSKGTSQPEPTKVRLSAMGEGKGISFGKQNYRIELDAENLNLCDLEPLIGSTNGSNARVSLHFKGQGQIDTGIAGQLDMAARQVFLDLGQTISIAAAATAKSASLMEADNAQLTGHVIVSPSRLDWQDVHLELAGMHATTSGHLKNWRQSKRTWTALLETEQTDLAGKNGKLARDLLLAVRKPVADDKAASMGQPALAGKAQVSVVATAGKEGLAVRATLDTVDVPALAVLSGHELSQTPLFSSLSLTNAAKISGSVQISQDGSATFNRLKLATGKETIVLSGVVNQARHEQHIEFQANSFSFDSHDLGDKGLAELVADEALAKRFDLAGYQLKGTADISGKIDQAASPGKAGHEKPQMLMKAAFKDCRLVMAKSTAAVDALSGQAQYDGSKFVFNNLSGHLADAAGADLGNFSVSGNLARSGASLDLRGRNLDVGFFARSMADHGARLATGGLSLASGRLADVRLHVGGSHSKPEVECDIACETLILSLPAANQQAGRELKVAGGRLSYMHQDGLSQFKFKDFDVGFASGTVAASGSVSDSPEGLKVEKLNLRTRGVEIADLRMLANVHSRPGDPGAHQLMSMLSSWQLTGRVWGDITLCPGDKNPLDGAIGLQNVSGVIGAGNGQTPFSDAGGVLAMAGSEVVVQAVTMRVGESMLLSDGTIKGYLSDRPQVQLNVKGQVKPQDLAAIMAEARGTLPFHISVGSRTPMAVQATVSGTGRDLGVVFYLQADARDSVYVANRFVKFNQPPDTAMTLDGNLRIQQSDKEQCLELKSFHLLTADTMLDACGSWRQDRDKGAQPVVELTVSSPNPVPTRVLAGMISPNLDTAGTTGTVKGTVSVAGTPKNFVWRGGLALSDVSVPGLGWQKVEGTLELPSWGPPGARHDGRPSEALLKLSQATVKGVDVKNLKARFVFDDGAVSTVRLTDLAGDVSQGQIVGKGWYRTENQRWHLDLSWDRIAVAEIFLAADKSAAEKAGGLTGIASGDIMLESTGFQRERILRDLQGGGNFLIRSGRVNNLGKLEEKLVHANLLQQGLFGFNVNNLVQSVLPVKTGEFREVSCGFDIANGVAVTDQLRFEGNDLRMWGAGALNLPASSLTMEVAGCVPRVSSSILSGAIGEVSRQVTVQKVLHVLTLRKLENLPPLPLLGDLAADNPRTFTFRLASAPKQTPDAVAHSIEKSFKWLPNKANASAHPIPRI